METIRAPMDFKPFFLFLDTSNLVKPSYDGDSSSKDVYMKQLDTVLDGIQAVGSAAASQPTQVDIIKQRIRVIRRKDILASLAPAPTPLAGKEPAKGKDKAAAVTPQVPSKAITTEEFIDAVEKIVKDDKGSWQQTLDERRLLTSPVDSPSPSRPPTAERSPSPTKTTPAAAARSKTPSKGGKAVKEEEVPAVFTLPVDGGFAAESPEAAAYNAALQLIQSISPQISSSFSHFYFILQIPQTLEETLALLPTQPTSCAHGGAGFGMRDRILKIDAVVELFAPPAVIHAVSGAERARAPSPGGKTKDAAKTATGSKPAAALKSPPAKGAEKQSAASDDVLAELDRQLCARYAGPVGAQLLRSIQDSIVYPSECIKTAHLAKSLGATAVIEESDGACVNIKCVRDIPVVGAPLYPPAEGDISTSLFDVITRHIAGFGVEMAQRVLDFQDWLGRQHVIQMTPADDHVVDDVMNAYSSRLDNLPDCMIDVATALFAMVDTVAVHAVKSGSVIPEDTTFVAPILPLDTDAIMVRLGEREPRSASTPSADDHLLNDEDVRSYPILSGTWMTVREAMSLYAGKAYQARHWWREKALLLSRDTIAPYSESGGHETFCWQSAPASFAEPLAIGITAGVGSATNLWNLRFGFTEAVKELSVDEHALFSECTGLPIFLAGRIMHLGLFPLHWQICMTNAIRGSYKTSPLFASIPTMEVSQPTYLVPPEFFAGGASFGSNFVTVVRGCARTRSSTFMPSVPAELRCRAEVARSAENILQQTDIINMATEFIRLYNHVPTSADAREVPQWDLALWDNSLQLAGVGHMADPFRIGSPAFDMIVDLLRQQLVCKASFGGQIAVGTNEQTDCQVVTVYAPTPRARVRQLEDCKQSCSLREQAVRPCIQRWMCGKQVGNQGSALFDMGTDTAWTESSVMKVADGYARVPSPDKRDQLEPKGSVGRLSYRVYPADQSSVLLTDCSNTPATASHTCRVHLHGNIFGCQPLDGAVNMKPRSHAFFACLNGSQVGNITVPTALPVAGSSMLHVESVPGPDQKPDKLPLTAWSYTTPSGLLINLTSSGLCSQQCPIENSPWPRWLPEKRRHHVGSHGMVIRELAATSGSKILHSLHPDGSVSWQIPAAEMGNLSSLYGLRSAFGSEESKVDDAATWMSAGTLIHVVVRISADGQGMLTEVHAGTDGEDASFSWNLVCSSMPYTNIDDEGNTIITRYDFSPILGPDWLPPPPAPAMPKLLYKKAAVLYKRAQEKAEVEGRWASLLHLVRGSVLSGVSADDTTALENAVVKGHLGKVTRIIQPDGIERIAHSDGTTFIHDAVITCVAKSGFATWECDRRFDEAAVAHAGMLPKCLSALATKLASSIPTGPKTRSILTMPDGSVLGCDYDATITGTVNGRVRLHRPDGLCIVGLDTGNILVRPATAKTFSLATSDRWVESMPNTDILDGEHASDTGRGLVPVRIPGTYEFTLRDGSISILDTQFNTYNVSATGQFSLDIAGALGVQNAAELLPARAVAAWDLAPLSHVPADEPMKIVLPKIADPAVPMVLVLPGRLTVSAAFELARPACLIDPLTSKFLALSKYVCDLCTDMSAREPSRLEKSVNLSSLSMLAPRLLQLCSPPQEPLGEAAEQLADRHQAVNLMASVPFPYFGAEYNRSGVGQVLGSPACVVSTACRSSWIACKKTRRKRLTKQDVFGGSKSMRFSVTGSAVTAATEHPSLLHNNNSDKESLSIPSASTQAMLVATQLPIALDVFVERLAPRLVSKAPTVCIEPDGIFKMTRTSPSLRVSYTVQRGKQLSKVQWQQLAQAAASSEAKWRQTQQHNLVHFECQDLRSNDVQELENEVSARIAASRAAAGAMQQTAAPVGASPVAVERARKAAARARAVKAAREEAVDVVHKIFQMRGQLQLTNIAQDEHTDLAVVRAMDGEDVHLPVVQIRDHAPSAPAQSAVEEGIDSSPLRASSSDAAADDHYATNARSQKAVLRQLAEALEHARMQSPEAPISSALYGMQTMNDSFRADGYTMAPENVTTRRSQLPMSEPAPGLESSYEGSNDIYQPLQQSPSTPEEDSHERLAEREYTPLPDTGEVDTTMPRDEIVAPADELQSPHGIYDARDVMPMPAAVPPLAFSLDVVDFGTVAVGEISRRTIQMFNLTNNLVRFRFSREHNSHRREGNSVRMVCEPGPLAGHLTRVIDVELLARTPGETVQVVEVSTPARSYEITVQAQVI